MPPAEMRAPEMTTTKVAAAEMSAAAEVTTAATEVTAATTAKVATATPAAVAAASAASLRRGNGTDQGDRKTSSQDIDFEHGTLEARGLR